MTGITQTGAAFRGMLIVWLVFVVPALAGCLPATHPVDVVTNPKLVSSEPLAAAHFARLDDLTVQLEALGPQVDSAEAATLANVALVYPMELAERYRLTQPPITHNLLVNVGLKPRGLCVHWTEDMLTRLQELNLQTLDLYWGIANPTRPFRLQHSTPVVTAKGRPFDSGILLDGWRDSGRLYYAKVHDDTRYAWELYFKATDADVPATD